MKLTIDNLNGLGPVDYSAALDRSAPFVLERTLNAPSLARGWLCLFASALPTPVRRARVTISSDHGLLLFTGYLATEPAAVYAGVASQGPVYRLLFNAISDEWLLDKQASGSQTGPAQSGTSAAVIATLVNRLAAGVISTVGLGSGRPLGVYVPPAGSTWSTQAATVAGAAYSSYRALNGALTLTPAGNVVHTFSDGAGTLTAGALALSAVRELANDVTVSGAMEPTVYWTELFEGDGTTAQFNLAGQPDAPAAGKLSYIADSFDQGALNLQTWAVDRPRLASRSGQRRPHHDRRQRLRRPDHPHRLRLDRARRNARPRAGRRRTHRRQRRPPGRPVHGRNPAGQLLRRLQRPAVRRSHSHDPHGQWRGGRNDLHPAQRPRLHAAPPAALPGAAARQADLLRDGRGRQSIPSAAASSPHRWPWSSRSATTASSSNTPVTVLYDGAVTTSPALCSFVAVNSVQLFGSVASVAVKRTGSAWIQTTDPTSGVTSTRIVGSRIHRRRLHDHLICNRKGYILARPRPGRERNCNRFVSRHRTRRRQGRGCRKHRC